MEFGQGRMIYILTLMKDDFYLLVSTAALITRSSLVTLTVNHIAAVTFEYKVRFVHCLHLATIHENSYFYICPLYISCIELSRRKTSGIFCF